MVDQPSARHGQTRIGGRHHLLHGVRLVGPSLGGEPHVGPGLPSALLRRCTALLPAHAGQPASRPAAQEKGQLGRRADGLPWANAARVGGAQQVSAQGPSAGRAIGLCRGASGRRGGRKTRRLRRQGRGERLVNRPRPKRQGGRVLGAGGVSDIDHGPSALGSRAADRGVSVKFVHEEGRSVGR